MSTEVQQALFNALEQLQAEHSKQVRLLQNEQRSIYNVLAERIESLTGRLDSLTEQLDAGSRETANTVTQIKSLSGQVQALTPVLDSLSRRLKK